MGLKAYLDGIKGEDKACIFLKKHNFTILERNFHSKFGEIDIIAIKDDILHFIEVKFTQNNYDVYERFDYNKYQKIIKTIEVYLLKKRLNHDFQVDLICIKDNIIEFIQNISF
ncbi:YraN family protein [Campylobacter taeniopygiae]|uniref:UPF0102 protein CQA75_05650 n=1 Tax=Campylobacter taeniopygiae TaxID=2510188 RepID=A0ABY2TIB2_9BACT|nr:YraN family protein [Campylobacter taeniopygiae]TKX33798.1 YraN family protein [Campylobacter taeniopygiae]